MMRTGSCLAAALMLLSASSGMADDWPQWMGPQRDSVWRENGIMKEFPAVGLQVRWRVPVSLGYSGPAVANGRVIVTDFVKKSGKVANSPGARNALAGTERVLCFSAADGKPLWKHEYDCQYELSYPGGPRCTPTVHEGLVHVLGAEGDLRCLEEETGELVWSKKLTEKYDTETPIWGFTAHPLVDGDLLYCMVGGEGSVAVAFNRKTGKEVWRALTAPEPGYCPPTMIEHGGTKQLLIWHPESLNSLNPKTGSVYWSVPLKPDYSMSVTAPRLEGDYLYASGIGNVSALLKLNPEQPAAEVVWRGTVKDSVYCSNSTPILEDGMIYGNDCRSGALIGVRMKDGERLWETFKPTTGNRRAGHGTAFLVQHKNGYFLFSETGDLVLASLSPDGYKEISRFHLLEPTNEAFGRDVVWTHPAFADRAVFARNDRELVCVDLAAE